MPENWDYRNPVRIVFGAGAFDKISAAISGRSCCIVTYPDAFFSGLIERLAGRAGEAAGLIRDVVPNPNYGSLDAACRTFERMRTRPQVIVALGGGSAIDTAKVVAASDGDFARVRSYVETGSGGANLGRTPIISVPTTSGTGSEVTSWATVWDSANGKKYSLARPELYPETAIVDPELTLGLPRDLTISTGLDALSHALESIWNTNANPVSSNHAVFAATEVMACLPALAGNLGDAALRAGMARASLFAGLAFSNTKTALAHSLSYHFTLKYGVPHGIACSFSLPMVMRSAIGRSEACDKALMRIFGSDLELGAQKLAGLLDRLGVSRRPADHGAQEDEWLAVVADAFEGERGRNFIGDRDIMLRIGAEAAAA
jgi:alcohol dehydrogenase